MGKWENAPLCPLYGYLYRRIFCPVFFSLEKADGGKSTLFRKTNAPDALLYPPHGGGWLLQLYGALEKQPVLRVLTGSLIGAVVPGLLLLAGNFDPVEKNDKAIYKNTKELLFVVVCGGAFGLCLWFGLPLQGIGAMLSIVGEVCLWAGVLWLILKNIFGKRKLPLRRISLVLVFCIIFAVGGFLP